MLISGINADLCEVCVGVFNFEDWASDRANRSAEPCSLRGPSVKPQIDRLADLEVVASSEYCKAVPSRRGRPEFPISVPMDIYMC